MENTPGERRNPIKVDEKGLQVWPVLRLHLEEKHWKSSVVPTVKNDKDVVEKKVGPHLTTFVVLTEPPLNILKPVKVLPKFLLSGGLWVIVIFNCKQDKVIPIQFTEVHEDPCGVRLSSSYHFVVEGYSHRAIISGDAGDNTSQGEFTQNGGGGQNRSSGSVVVERGTHFIG